MFEIKPPIHRSKLRQKSGKLYYGVLRRCLWIRMRKRFVSKRSAELLPYPCFSHKTLLRRQLKDVDMWLQENKIINLKLAIQTINGIVLRPGEIFSYWKCIGKPTKGKGYVDGMVLKGGGFEAATGGGLCQLANLIFWMTLHTPLTTLERHRHGYDVFPDSNRTQPFGSGATCFYPHIDLMIQNNTRETYQLLISVGDEFLEGEWRATAPAKETFQIIERNHEMRAEFWGGYTRHNELYQQVLDLDGNFLREELVVKNAAIMMYSPFLEHISN